MRDWYLSHILEVHVHSRHFLLFSRGQISAPFLIENSHFFLQYHLFFPVKKSKKKKKKKKDFFCFFLLFLETTTTYEKQCHISE